MVRARPLKIMNVLHHQRLHLHGYVVAVFHHRNVEGRKVGDRPELKGQLFGTEVDVFERALEPVANFAVANACK